MEVKPSPDVLTTRSCLRVIEIDPQTDLRWEALVTSIPAIPSPVYHPVWLKVLEEVYGYKSVHLACEDATGQVVGILPLFSQQGWGSKRKFISVFTGPLASDDQAMAALLQAAIERTRAESGAQLHLKVMSNAFDGLVEGLVGVSVYETYMLALPERPDLLHLPSSLKRAINKATRLGVQVRQAQTERKLRAWYDLYVQTMRKFAALPYPYRYYKLAWQRLHPQGRLRLLLAEHVEAGHRRLLAGFLLLLWGQTISYAFAGWRREDRALQPNDLLHWQVIQDASAEGFRWYDFGDVELGNQGLAHYKRKWGAQAKMVYDYSYPILHDGVASTHRLSRNRVHHLVQGAWQHLPIKVIGLVSDWYHALHLY
jgi:hypothetical protein